MLNLISKIEANRIIISSIDLPKQFKEEIHRESLLRSSVFSAKIEGNKLNVEDYPFSAKEKERFEIQNIVSALKYLDKKLISNSKLLERLIFLIHREVMKNLSNKAGKYRNEMWAVYNSAGYPVYIATPPSEIQISMDKLLTYINKEEGFPIITAFISHLIFEKIHPFADGNGRVGRILIFVVLKLKGVEFNTFIPFEEFLYERRNDYYHFLDVGLKETEAYLVFMLKVFLEQTEGVKARFIKRVDAKDNAPLLPPRQREIYLIIFEHKIVNFDFIRRRFLKVPQRTLRYDLKKLVDSGYVKKVGNTKGVFYSI